MDEKDYKGNRKGSRGGWLAETLFSRAAASVATGLSAAIFLGCMSINLGGSSSGEVKLADETGMMAQEGKVPVRPGHEQVIYYPLAYSSPPNLEVEGAAGLCDIVEQRENCFKVRFWTNVATTKDSLAWKARGAKVLAPKLADSTVEAKADAPKVVVNESRPTSFVSGPTPVGTFTPAPVPVSTPSHQH